ncbi:MAG: sarcosine oxidase subunit alpha family protein [Steroidobacteraceae bacterium]|nr:sarcosine oxidase subunit alpha family protein [Steroidobacteraceae bacterium]
MGYRLDSGGHIDRGQRLSFRWNGRRIYGYAGDTIASALLAEGVRIVGRGMKYHRPRGLLSAGVEEPNALVTLGRGAALEPNARATMIPVRDGLEVRAQNAWPAVGFDLGRVFDCTAPLWPAGFYNKTFTWPSWHFYEPLIRRTAGLGRPPRLPDPSRYEAVNAHCDLLIVGAGPAGLLAAKTAVRAGLSVILVEQDYECGVELLRPSAVINDEPAITWVAGVLGELAASRNVTVLTSTTCFGLYDHGTAGLLQRLDLGSGRRSIRQRYWRVRARQTLLATGAIEQPLVFGHNDLPGIMLAGAVRQYANRYAVAAGRRVVLATNNDSAYLAALDLAAAGIEVPMLVDSRIAAPAALADRVRHCGIEIVTESLPLEARGRRSLAGLRIARLGPDGAIAGTREIDCDALGMSGGWAPAAHLYSHARGALSFNETRRCFVPAGDAAPICAGGVAGAVTLAETFADAARAVHLALSRAAVPAFVPAAVPEVQEPPATAHAGPVRSDAPGGRREWLDFQHDVTVKDVRLAFDEGFDHVELLKRYTTAGMSVDQGKTGNLNTLLVAAELRGEGPAEAGTTTFRPPWTPVTLGALAGRAKGGFYAPRRLLPAHAEHEALGPHWWEAGGWMRPACYPRAGESPQAAAAREAVAVRSGVGVFDASPLGKIEVSGRDALGFLDRFYVNNLLTLGKGRVRYGLMLNENGVIIDDGTVAKLADDRFLVTTTSGGATRIAAWLEEWRQCEWPELEVFVTPVTTQWATIAVAGPRSRELLSRFETDILLDAESFPHLSLREGALAGAPARICRVSFSGELGYEINVPAGCGAALWRALLQEGASLGVAPYGIETVLLLRLEKGFLHVGVDTDGTTFPADVGWGEVAARKQADFIGKRSLSRAGNLRPDRLQLVGLSGADAKVLVAGAHLRLPGTQQGSDGWVTSAAMSPALGRPIALAMLRGGRARLGETVAVHDLDRRGAATVVAPAFYDPDGKRLHG